MKISLFLSDRIIVYKLPKKVSGSFSFDDCENDGKLINIESYDDVWYLYSTSEVQVIDNGNVIKNIQISDNHFYILKKQNKMYVIYVSSLLRNASIYNYDCSKELLIGNNSNCNINYKCSLLSDSVVKVTSYNDQFLVENTGSSKIYINKKGVNESKCMMKQGDELEIYGLRLILLSKIIIIVENENVLINKQLLNFTNYSTFSDDVPQNIEVVDENLYKKTDYASKAPRIRRNIEEKTIKISPPPRNNNEKELPFILVVGPMLTLGITSVITLVTYITKIKSGQATLVDSIPQIVMAVAMLISTIVWPLLTRSFNRHLKEKNKKDVEKKYTEYLNEKSIELETVFKNQKIIIIENLISLDDCINNIKTRNINFWSKRSDQNDFMVARVGIGKEPMVIDIQWPEEDFSIEENDLKKQAEAIIEKYKYIDDVPLGYSFYNNIITAVMGNKNKTINFINNIILQFISFYNYEELKIVIFTDNPSNWEYVKYLNHCFNNERNFRFFGSDYNSCKNVADYLSDIIKKRLNSESKDYKPYYFIIVDNYEMIEQYDFIDKISESEENIGFSLVIAENKLSNLPSKCSNFINLNEGESGILKNSYEKQEQIFFKDEINYNIDMMSIVKILSNIPIEFEEKSKSLPSTLTFLEMENVGRVEQLNILNRWSTNDSTKSLKCDIGIDEQGNLIELDLHEKFHGPHGLIAGMTGSGKSEFIITYILSMCINYSPDDVAFILIDYKGGGVAFAFENRNTGIVLPHLAGTITNLDKSEMNRTLVSINSEINRRQEVFNSARDLLGESTIDIYKYQKYYKEGKLTIPVPHLFIICDEFAELKTQQPDFMDNLISVARIGRSLGIHLILATQKPSGIVNDQIWSNTRFRVCLKVQDESDSREVLKKSDAAYLKNSGSFYLQVGYDEYYSLGQSGWCGAKYYPSESIYRNIDKSLNFIGADGTIIKNVKNDDNKKVVSQGEQLNNILVKIIETAKIENKFAKKLWLDNIPNVIYISDLEKKYNFSVKPYNVISIIGEYDEPENQKQGLVQYDFLRDGNTIIYGNDGSESENLIVTIIYSSIKDHTVDEINYYIVDYGSESFRKFANVPHMGGIVFMDETEKFNNLFKMIKEEMINRKKIFADYGGQYYNYINSGKYMPLMAVILNNYESIYDSYKDLYDELPELVRDSERYGIIYIITCNSIGGVHTRISQNFNNNIAFKLNEDVDYTTLFSVRNLTKPRDIYGRGVVKVDGAHEFQTASIYSLDKVNEYLAFFIDNLNKSSKSRAKKIPTLPDRVNFEDIISDDISLKKIPIGITKKSLEVCNLSIQGDSGLIISCSDLENSSHFCNSLCVLLKKIPKNELIIMDCEDMVNDIFRSNNYFNSDYSTFMDKIKEYVEKISKDANYSGSISILIYGIDKMVSKTDDSSKVSDFMKLIKETDFVNIIIVDSESKLKNYTYDSWFTTLFKTNCGIWVGRGLYNQNLLSVMDLSKEMSLNYGNDFGFYIKNGYSDLIKLIDFFDEDDVSGK